MGSEIFSLNLGPLVILFTLSQPARVEQEKLAKVNFELK